MATPYKMKGSPMARNFGIGASPMKSNETTRAEKRANLLKAVPNKEAYDKLSTTDKKGFDKAGKKAGLPQKKSPMKEPITAAILASIAGAAVSGGIGAASKAASKKKADKLSAENEAKEASAKSIEGMGDIGSKTKLTD